MNFGIFLMVTFPSLLVALIAKFYFKHSITWQEFTAHIVCCTILVGIIYACGFGMKMHDTQILNGQITKKERVEVSCDHSYECPPCWESCSTDSNGNQSCTQHCSTCYDHDYDVDWRVHTDIDGDFNIDRIDSQGVKKPPRFDIIQIGEPYSTTDSYTNYVKAVPESLFNTSNIKLEQYATMIPAYPEVYDYYRINRVMSVGVPIKNIKQWNDYLSERLKTIGKKKQANINIIFVNTPDQTYRYALEAAWVGGKKNDITVILGMTQPNKIDWVDTITFGGNAGNSLLTVLMHDRLMALVSFDYKTVIDVIGDTVLEKFDRKPMQDYEYLKASITPPDWCIYTAMILGLLCSIGLSIFFHRNVT